MGGTLPCVHHVGNGLLRPCPNSAPFTLPQCQVLTISNAPGLPRWLSEKKESACQRRRPRRQGLECWGGKIPWRRAWLPPTVFLPGKSHGRGAWWATVHGVAKSETRLSAHAPLTALDTQPSESVSRQRWASARRGATFSSFPLMHRLPLSLRWLVTKVGFLHSHGVKVAGGSGTLR